MKELSGFFKLLSDPNRLRIICLLMEEKTCVCVLSAVLGISQPAVSKHLARLKKAGLVAEEQDSFWTNYRLNPAGGKMKKLFTLIEKWAERDPGVKADIIGMRKTDRTKCCVLKRRKNGKKQEKREKHGEKNNRSH